MSATLTAERTTEFRILGPLDVVHRGAALRTGGQKKKALLARLVLEANRTVAVDELVDALWGDQVPPTAVKMVHIYVSQLRKVLPRGIVRTQPPGYVLDVAPEAVDLHRFRGLRAEAAAALTAGETAAAAELLRDALALWRGPALGEFSEPFAVAEAAHLEELRLAAVEDRIDADLALGRHADVVGELRALAARHPLRQRLHVQLMLALYRAGRHAEALDAYRELRRTLRDELGIEPAAALTELEYRILTQDASLDLAPPPGPAPPRAVRPAADGFVGRADELRRLEAAFDDAMAGRGTTVLLGGPAGIGKTRLATELGERARARGATVLTGHCIDLVGAALPYAPIVEALRPLRGSDAVDGLQELSRLLPAPGAAAPDRGHDAPAGTSRLRLLEELLAALDRLGATAPVVLVVEDLHWADGSTLDVLAFLAHAVRERRVLVVASRRRDERAADDGVDRLATSLVRSGRGEAVDLGPLAPRELEALLARTSAAPLPDGLAEAVCARSEGNPFYAQELLAAALRGEHEVPPVLRDLLLAGFACLDVTSRSVARVAAAVGRDVPHRLLTAAVCLPEHDVLEGLRQAVEHGVLVPDHRRGTYRFRHALIAEAVYATLLPGEREDVHERLARVLTDEPALAACRASAGELAEHWLAAGRPVEALTASVQAARDAEAVSGLCEALRHLERVLELWDQVPHAEQVAGVAMPAVLAWAAELAGAVATETAAARPAVAEARELYPLALVLESIAIRASPPLDAAALHALRAANDRMRAAAGDPVAAMLADDAFHARLAGGCGNAPLLAALRPVKQTLLRYERLYMRDAGRVERSVAQHDGIIDALARGDHREAARRLHENITSGLPALADALDR